jgi:hypothetical protein
VKCEFCEKEITEKSFKNSYTVCCEHCRYIFSLKGPGHLIAINYEYDPPGTMIESPDFEKDTKVILVNSMNRFFLEFGTVFDNDLLHVRVDFNGTKIWVPKNTVEKVPEEWL